MTIVVSPISSSSYQIAESIYVSGIRELVETVVRFENKG
jgi:hypothetical protein